MRGSSRDPQAHRGRARGDRRGAKKNGRDLILAETNSWERCEKPVLQSYDLMICIYTYIYIYITLHLHHITLHI